MGKGDFESSGIIDVTPPPSRKITADNLAKQFFKASFNDVKIALKLKDILLKQIEVEDKFIHASGELKGLYSATIRRGILEKLWNECKE